MAEQRRQGSFLFVNDQDRDLAQRLLRQVTGGQETFGAAIVMHGREVASCHVPQEHVTACRDALKRKNVASTTGIHSPSVAIFSPWKLEDRYSAVEEPGNMFNRRGMAVFYGAVSTFVATVPLGLLEVQSILSPENAILRVENMPRATLGFTVGAYLLGVAAITYTALITKWTSEATVGTHLHDGHIGKSIIGNVFGIDQRDRHGEKVETHMNDARNAWKEEAYDKALIHAGKSFLQFTIGRVVSGFER